MTFEIIVIVVLAGLLWLLLRHWPETEGVVKQQVNTRKPLEEHSTPAKKEGVTTRVWQLLRKWWATLLDWFESIRQKNANKVHQPTDPEKQGAKLVTNSSAVSEPQTESELLLAKAEVAQRKGDYAKAEQYLVKAASLDPKNPKIYSKLGIVYLEQGENWDEAEQSFRQALKYEPQNGYVHNNLGLVLYYQDKFTAAAKEFELSINQDDKVASRHINLGLAYSSLRQFAKAESCYKRALKLDPNNSEYQELAKEAGLRKKNHQQR